MYRASSFKVVMSEKSWKTPALIRREIARQPYKCSTLLYVVDVSSRTADTESPVPTCSRALRSTRCIHDQRSTPSVPAIRRDRRGGDHEGCQHHVHSIAYITLGYTDTKLAISTVPGTDTTMRGSLSLLYCVDPDSCKRAACWHMAIPRGRAHQIIHRSIDITVE